VLLTKYYVGDQIKKNDMSGACGMYGRGAYRVLVRTHKRKTPLGRHGCSWEDNIKINIKALGWKSMGWRRIGTGIMTQIMD
jgi:hypothetical protein